MTLPATLALQRTPAVVATDFGLAVWDVVAASAPYLLLGLLVAGLVKALLPSALVVRHLGRDDTRAVVVASLVGAPLPLCSCSVVPTAAALRRRGASKGATTAFLIATPETGVDSIGITWALLDPLLTIARPLAAILTAVGAGALVNLLVARDVVPAAPGAPSADPADPAIEPDPALARGRAIASDSSRAPDPATTHAGARAAAADPACCASDVGTHGAAECHEDEGEALLDAPPPRGPLAALREAFRYGFGPLLADLTPWLVIGFLLAGLITVLVPDDAFTRILPGGWPARLAMLVLGIPMYVCATASTPIAAALVLKGLDPGAALIFMLAGPATNAATLAVVGGMLGRGVVAIYVATISVCALLIGALVDALYAAWDLVPAARLAEAHEGTHAALATASAIAFAALLAVHGTRLLARRAARPPAA